MTYRPYPSPDRARHQLARQVRHEDAPAMVMNPTAARLMNDLIEGLRRVRMPRPALPGFPAAAPSDPGREE